MSLGRSAQGREIADVTSGQAEAAHEDGRRWRAFLSYSRADEPFAGALQRRLERYRLPSRLARARPDEPRVLGPIFRDRTALSAAADLTLEVRAALARSEALIVVCSPSAARSSWVGREIALFQQLHPTAPVLAALAAGSPPDCFPPALTSAGAGEAATPLAADFRRGGDGRLALLKLVAALAKVSLEDLVERDAQRRLRRAGLTALASLAGAALASLLAIEAVVARQAAERERARGERVIAFLLGDLRQKLKAVGRLDALASLNAGALRYYQGQDLRRLPPDQLAQRAKLLQAIGEDEEKRGRFLAAKAQFEEAGRTTDALLRGRPGEAGRIFAAAQSEYWLGLIDWRLEDGAEAARRFRAYAALAHRLTQTDPANPDWQVEAGDADSNLGVFVLRRTGEGDRAQPLFAAALAHYLAARRLRPGDRQIESDIADGYAWMGSARRRSQDLVGALAWHLAQRRLLGRLLATDARDYDARADLVGNEISLGRDLGQLGKFASALEWLRKARDAAAVLAREDPENRDIARARRAIQLFTARDWLLEPMASRPAPRRIAEAIGDCAADQRRKGDEELAAYCALLHSALVGAKGPRGVFAPQASALGPDRLTERWLLDLPAEAAALGPVYPPRRP